MNCDRIARWYRFFEYATFGRALERRRLEYLNEVAGAKSVLILGDGDGRFTAEFVLRNLEASVDSIDVSRTMLALAERRMHGGSATVKFRLGDARTIALPGKYDLVVAHFFLDCFSEDELDGLVERIAGRCTMSARWVVSEFGLPAAGAGRIGARVLIRVMYFFFRMTTGLEVTRLPDYAQVLARKGFRVARRRATFGGLLVSELWERTP